MKLFKAQNAFHYFITKSFIIDKRTVHDDWQIPELGKPFRASPWLRQGLNMQIIHSTMRDLVVLGVLLLANLVLAYTRLQ